MLQECDCASFAIGSTKIAGICFPPRQRRRTEPTRVRIPFQWTLMRRSTYVNCHKEFLNRNEVPGKPKDSKL